MNKNLLRILHISFLILISSAALKAQHSITVTDFKVSASHQKVMIDWKTDGAAETNYFAIQKSTDGINFKTVALVLGPDPKKNADSYGGFDKSKITKHSYYRIVHIDTNGNEQITEAKLLAKA